jgi:hypothetical protein
MPWWMATGIYILAAWVVLMGAAVLVEVAKAWVRGDDDRP